MENGNLDWRWFVGPADTVFDVGANVGAKTELFLQHAARVVCVEPQPECVKALKKRFKHDRRVTLVPKGLAEKPGSLDLSVCTEASTISTFSAEWKTGRFANYKWDKVVRVPVTTLDEVIQRYGAPAYCKIDVEGFEMSVLRGLSRPVPLLSFEFAREFMDRARACVDYLRHVGFQRFNFIRGEGSQFACQGWLDGNALFDRLDQIADPELWGDIYAQYGEHFAGTPPQRAAADARPAPGRLGRAVSCLRRCFGAAPSGAEPSLEAIHNFNQRNRDQWVAARAATVPPGSRVLDVGAGTCPYRPLFAKCHYQTQDFKKYEGVKLGNTREYGLIDYVSDITHIPLADGSLDVILCTEVLEHVPEPIEALRELARLLKPGGRMFLTAPLGSGLHQLPFHYYGGYTPEWYRHFAKKFALDIVEITANGGFFKLLAQECTRFAWTFEEHRHCHGKKGKALRKLFGESLPRYLYALDERRRNEQFTVGYHVELRKPDVPAGKNP